MLENLVRNAVDEAYWKYKHAWHKEHALKAVAVVEKYNSQKLTPKIKKMADDYAVQVLGKKDYALWLYVFSLVYGEFKEGWIPTEYFYRYVAPIRGINMASCFKTFTNAALRTEVLPDLAYYINGAFYNRDFSVIKISDLREIVAAQEEEVFVKKDYSMQGRGIYKLDLASITEETFKGIGNCVIQSLVKNHKFFEAMMPDSLSTVRITTVTNSEGKIEYRASFLRLGRKNDVWVKSKNSIMISVIDREGELDKYGYNDDWERWTNHPDTNFSFSKVRIPLFKEAVETCLELHARVPHFRVVGWDVAICPDEKIRLLEWNGALPGVTVSQATTGPCFSGLGWEQLGKTKAAFQFLA